MSARVLYLHGFASSPRGRKVEALESRFAPEGIRIDAPDLNRPSFAMLDFEAMVETAVARAGSPAPAAVVGSSLGALVALEAARRGVEAPLVLIAPALGFGRRWIEALPPGDPVEFFHHGENREMPIHRGFFEGMAGRPPEEPPVPPVTAIMGRRDESVPFELVRGVWETWRESRRLAPGSRWIEIAEGDHGLTGFADEIAGAIREAIEFRRCSR